MGNYAHAICWICLAILAVLYVIFKNFKIEAKISLDLKNLKIRLKLIIFGFIPIMDFILKVTDNGLMQIKKNGKTKILPFKPPTKFEENAGINILTILKDKVVIVNMLNGVLNDAYYTSMIDGGIISLVGLIQGVAYERYKTIVNLNIYSTIESCSKTFMKFKAKTNLSLIIFALFKSIG